MFHYNYYLFNTYILLLGVEVNSQYFGLFPTEAEAFGLVVTRMSAVCEVP